MAARRILSALSFAAALTGIQAQTSYTDAATGITFLTKVQTGGHSFGLALPEDSSSDFIGQISAPITTEGWAGVSLTSSMTGGLLVVAWPNGDEVVASLRKAAGYSTPDVYTGDATLRPIAEGISVNETAFTYTFLCQGCVDIGTMSFTSDGTSVPIAWALSETAVTTPASPSTAMSAHADTGGQGIGVYALADARSADYATWAALAADATTGNGTDSGSGNSTAPVNGTSPITSNTTAVVSNTTYDYIVVGGGGSGIITAQRLVETGKSVLLLERGKASYYPAGGRLTVPWNDTVSIYEVPAMYNWLSAFPGNDALCSDTPAMAGCILGGGTAVNGLAFIKPPAHDFDDKWPTGWKWSDVEASAERFYERNPGTLLPSADGKYYDYAVYDVLSKNLASAGWNSTDTSANPNDKSKIFSYAAINVLNGKRAGPVATYLPLAQAEANFKLMLNTLVLRAVRTNSTITGVETQLEDGSRMIINVNKGGKVILASGAMSTPRILFRSGIGPSDQINGVKNGTTSIKLPEESEWINSPVGFVKDHTVIAVTFKVNDGMKIMSSADYNSPSQTNLDLWNKQSGPLTESSIMRLNTFRTVTTSDNKTLIVQTHNYATKNDTIDVLFILTHGTTSEGTLALKADGSTYWSQSPYLQTTTDKEAMAIAIDEWLAMSRLSNSTITYVGGTNDTGADVVANITPSAGTHMTGTAIMGLDDGSKGGKSVVDTNCKVYGTDNLYVVDASMHADVPTGNTQVIVAVAAEHAVQKIIASGSTNETSAPGTGYGYTNGSTVTSGVASATGIVNLSISSVFSTVLPPSVSEITSVPAVPSATIVELSSSALFSTVLPPSVSEIISVDASAASATAVDVSSSAQVTATAQGASSAPPASSAAASTLSTRASSAQKPSGNVPHGPTASASASAAAGGNPYWHDDNNSYWTGHWGQRS